MNSQWHLKANKIIPMWITDRNRLVSEITLALEDAYQNGIESRVVQIPIQMALVDRAAIELFANNISEVTANTAYEMAIELMDARQRMQDKLKALAQEGS